MSCRWKKKQARRKKKKQKLSLDKGAGEMVRITSDAGTFIGRKRSESGWMNLEGYTMKSAKHTPDMVMQQSCCAVTGEIFVKLLDGRFKGLPDEQLREIIARIQKIFASAGGMVGTNPTLPLWLQAEYLDNALDFELDPPCGCPSTLKEKIKTA